MFESISNFIALEISFGTRCHPNLSIKIKSMKSADFLLNY
jgi:hypothetical protein